MVDFLERVNAHGARLTGTEQKIIEALIQQRRETAFLSGPQLADRLNVHGAATTRLAQKLGYKGYPDLRAAVQQELLASQDAAARMRRSVANTAGRGQLALLVDSEIRALENLLEMVAQADLDRAADMLFAAKRVFLFGQGHAGAISAFLQRRLDRFGMTTIALSGRGHDMAEKLVSLGAGDLVLGLAFRKAPGGYAPLMTHALAVGADTLLISDLVGLRLQPRPSLVLAAPRGRSESEFQTPNVPFVLVGALLLTLAERHEQPMLAALERLSDLFAILDET